ncbi:MAG: hypothetical protein Q7T11_00295 [Deltaproteobacteria bacterium]|nr:hypothetical protein [Deltaproteobacteria bacterium]
MRTTIVFEDSLGQKIRRSTGKRGLSQFVSHCVREHFERQEKLRRLKELEQAYARAAKIKEGDFAAIEGEEWPEW